jgi:YHS domain-containing protein
MNDHTTTPYAIAIEPLVAPPVPPTGRSGPRVRGWRLAIEGRWCMAIVVDPVCGMRIDPDDAVATVEYEGRTFYFCSEACRDGFLADPAAYAT